MKKKVWWYALSFFTFCPAPVVLAIACGDEEPSGTDITTFKNRLTNLQKTNFEALEFASLRFANPTPLTGALLGITVDIPNSIEVSFTKTDDFIVKYQINHKSTPQEKFEFDVKFTSSSRDVQKLEKLKSSLASMQKSILKVDTFSNLEIPTRSFVDARVALGISMDITSDVTIKVNKVKGTKILNYQLSLPLDNLNFNVELQFFASSTNLENFQKELILINKTMVQSEFFRNSTTVLPNISYRDPIVEQELGMDFGFTNLPSTIKTFTVTKFKGELTLAYKIVDVDDYEALMEINIRHSLADEAMLESAKNLLVSNLKTSFSQNEYYQLALDFEDIKITEVVANLKLNADLFSSIPPTLTFDLVKKVGPMNQAEIRVKVGIFAQVSDWFSLNLNEFKTYDLTIIKKMLSTSIFTTLSKLTFEAKTRTRVPLVDSNIANLGVDLGNFRFYLPANIELLFEKTLGQAITYTFSEISTNAILEQIVVNIIHYDFKVEQTVVVDGNHELTIGSALFTNLALDSTSLNAQETSIKSILSRANFGSSSQIANLAIEQVFLNPDPALWDDSLGKFHLLFIAIDSSFSTPLRTFYKIEATNIKNVIVNRVNDYNFAGGFFFKTSSQKTYLGSRQNGLFLLNNDKTLTQISFEGITAVQFEGFMFEDTATDRLFLGTKQGIFQIVNNRAMLLTSGIEPSTVVGSYSGFMFQGSQGTIYYAPPAGPLYTLNGDSSFTKVVDIPKVNEYSLGSMFEDSQKNLFVITLEGLYEKPSGGQTFAIVNNFNGDVLGSRLFEDQGNIYFLAGNGLWKRSSPSAQFVRLVDFNLLYGFMHKDQSGQLWLGSTNDGLYRVNQDGTLVSVDGSPKKLGGGHIYETNQQFFIIGPKAGIWRLNNDHTLSKFADMPDVLNDETIVSNFNFFVPIAQNVYYIGNSLGLYRVVFRSE